MDDYDKKIMELFERDLDKNNPLNHKEKERQNDDPRNCMVAGRSDFLHGKQDRGLWIKMYL